MSTWLMIALLIEYVILCLVSFCEGKAVLSLYWLGACILNLAVLWMAK